MRRVVLAGRVCNQFIGGLLPASRLGLLALSTLLLYVWRQLIGCGFDIVHGKSKAIAQPVAALLLLGFPLLPGRCQANDSYSRSDKLVVFIADSGAHDSGLRLLPHPAS